MATRHRQGDCQVLFSAFKSPPETWRPISPRLLLAPLNQRSGEEAVQHGQCPPGNLHRSGAQPALTFPTRGQKAATSSWATFWLAYVLTSNLPLFIAQHGTQVRQWSAQEPPFSGSPCLLQIQLGFPKECNSHDFPRDHTHVHTVRGMWRAVAQASPLT